MGIVAQVIVTGVVTGSFYALVAAAMQLVYDSARILNFGQGGLVVSGMFAMWWLNPRQSSIRSVHFEREYCCTLTHASCSYPGKKRSSVSCARTKRP